MSGRFQGEAPYVATLVPDDWRVTLGFQGWNGNIVEVPLPIDPFLLMPIPGVSTPEPAFYYEGTCCVSPSTQYILGLVCNSAGADLQVNSRVLYRTSLNPPSSLFTTRGPVSLAHIHM